MSPFILSLIIIVIFIAIFGETIMMKINELIWAKEKPEMIIGLRVRLAQFDGLGQSPPEELNGSINEFNEGAYRIDFDKPFVLDGKKENSVFVTARHGGYPVSRISKRGILAVGGKFESGRGLLR